MDVKKEIRKSIERRFGRERVTFILKIFGVIALMSSLGSIGVDGKDFFSKTLPSLASAVGRKIVTGRNFRPLLARHILNQDFGYSSVCIANVTTADLDSSGDFGDLIIEIYRPDRNGMETCPEYKETENPEVRGGAENLVLKSSGWKGIWPQYRLLLQTDGSGLPITFHTNGPFLIRQPYGVSFEGYVIYGYVTESCTFLVSPTVLVESRRPQSL